MSILTNSERADALANFIGAVNSFLPTFEACDLNVRLAEDTPERVRAYHDLAHATPRVAVPVLDTAFREALLITFARNRHEDFARAAATIILMSAEEGTVEELMANAVCCAIAVFHGQFEAAAEGIVCMQEIAHKLGIKQFPELASSMATATIMGLASEDAREKIPEGFRTVTLSHDNDEFWNAFA